MRKAPTALVILALVAPLLGGCNSTFGRALGFRGHTTSTPVPDGRDYAEKQLAIGKSALDAGQYASAIEAFRNARMFSASAADAYNGMAIAYLQLGRPDLTERFLKLAILERPTDKRFQANLDRFYRSATELAERKTREENLALANSAMQRDAVRVLVAAGNHSVVTAQTSTGAMQRVSANEVVIGARSTLAAVPDGVRRRATVAAATPMPIRRRNPQYPARIVLPAPAATPAVTSGYPIRVGLSTPPSPIRVSKAAP